MTPSIAPSSVSQQTPRFWVVDLNTQMGAVARHVKGWAREEVLDWLGRFGKVTQSRLNPDVYNFLAPSGLHTRFILRGDGEFSIFSGRNIYRLKEGVFFTVGDDKPHRL